VTYPVDAVSAAWRSWGPSGSRPWLLGGSEDPWLSVAAFWRVWLCRCLLSFLLGLALIRSSPCRGKLRWWRNVAYGVADSTGRRNTRAEPFSYGVFSHRAKPDREGPTAKCSPNISQRFRSLPAVLHRCRLEPSMLALIPQHTLRLLRLRQSVASTH